MGRFALLSLALFGLQAIFTGGLAAVGYTSNDKINAGSVVADFRFPLL
jgi:hypothetical protein